MGHSRRRPAWLGPPDPSDQAQLIYVQPVNEMSAASLEPISVTVALDRECAWAMRRSHVAARLIPNGKPGWQGSTLAPSENPVTRR
jgi:hypothetical protein